jgi:hypothetical protein
MMFAQQVHTQLAFMGITTIECPLPNPGSYSYLMHADSIDAMLGEETVRNFQDTPAMLCCVASFEARARHKWFRQARRPIALMRFFHRFSPS